MERELDKADNMIRLFFNDVQMLKDGRHPQAEQMYRRCVLIQVNLKHNTTHQLQNCLKTNPNAKISIG